MYLHLYTGYNIPTNLGKNKKLGQRYTGPFDMLERVGRLAYHLDLPSHWRIHNMVNISFLEPALKGNDPFNHTHNLHLTLFMTSSTQMSMIDTISNKSWQSVSAVSFTRGACLPRTSWGGRVSMNGSMLRIWRVPRKLSTSLRWWSKWKLWPPSQPQIASRSRPR